MNPAKKRRAIEEISGQLPYSQRRICTVIGQARSTQRYEPTDGDDEGMLKGRIIALAMQYGRYGYRTINGMLTNEGWTVNHKSVERIWRQEGLKVPQKQPKRKRLWLNDGSCIRLRPRHTDHVWSYDFISDRTSDTRPMKMIDNHGRAQPGMPEDPRGPANHLVSGDRTTC